MTNDPKKMSKIKPFLANFEWKGINFPPDKKDLHIFEKNNATIAVNILFVNDDDNDKKMKPVHT